MQFEPYTIYLADVPFEDSDETKIRPVVIVEDKIYTIQCLSITSNISRPENYVLKEWKSAGLREPSSVLIQYSIELSRDSIGRKIGRLHPVDIIELKNRS